jgi:hypothetical protein
MVNIFSILKTDHCILFIQDDLDTIIQKDISDYFLQQALLYLQIDEKIHFTTNGKPYLQDSFLHFNISHSEQYWVAAFSLSPIGIDIEAVSNSSLIPSLDPILGVQTLKDWCAMEAIIKCMDEELDAMMHIKPITALEKYKMNNTIINTTNIAQHNQYAGFIASEINDMKITVFENKLGFND